MLAFALRSDGWYLRCDMIWEKNSMPESVKDRPTRNHEYVFLLSKSERYHCDMKAIEEDGVVPAGTLAAKGANARSDVKGVNGRPPKYWEYTGKRNKRSVWKVNTQPFKGAHFAVMPEALVVPCILAGCPEGGTVLDPFTGSGTVGAVALKMQRRFIGVELNPEYAAMARKRMASIPEPLPFKDAV
jgi:DNA modification methylase